MYFIYFRGQQIYSTSSAKELAERWVLMIKTYAGKFDATHLLNGKETDLFERPYEPIQV